MALAGLAAEDYNPTRAAMQTNCRGRSASQPVGQWRGQAKKARIGSNLRLNMLDKGASIVYIGMAMRIGCGTVPVGVQRDMGVGRVNGKWLYACSIAVLMLLPALAGCVDVEVVDATPGPAASGPSSNGESVEDGAHDLAILAVDFDPPLDYHNLIILRQSVALLVVVENTGNTTEREVTVQAQLTSPDDAQLLLAGSTTTESIAPGEVQILRFTPLADIPHYLNFHLEVLVDPVEGEADTSDNRKVLDIQILPKQ